MGKAYEKFNAIRPDNYDEFKKALKSGKKGEENKFNKKFGVYYTPREIVHYMCQQSLINYLITQTSILNISKNDIEILIHTGEHISENEERVIRIGKETGTYFHKLPESIRKNAKLIDEKLADITVCDPAVGSGAFPVGMMSEIIKARNVLSVFIEVNQSSSLSIYNFKRQCIEHSLYGVDIDPGAVEIAKLRLWLSLIVDEDDIKNIKPLPNLDYRIMQGNSLISEFMGISFDDDENKNLKRNIKDLDIEIKKFDKDIKDKEKEFFRYYNKFNEKDQNISNKLEELTNRKNKLNKKQIQLTKKLNNLQYEDKKITNLINKFQQKKDEFLNESNVSRKSKVKEEVENLLVEIFETKLSTQSVDYFYRLKNIENKYSTLRNEKQREELIKQDKKKLYKESGFNLESVEKQLREFTSGKKIKPFFLWNLYFSEILHNKGGFDVVIANPPYVRQEKIKDQKPALQKQNYEVYNSTSDLYTYFYERSYHILKPNGFSCFISSNKWMRAKYGEKLRRFFKEKTTLKQIIDFNGYQVFDATVDTDILLFQKTKLSENIVNILYIQRDFTPSTDITNYFNSHKLEMKQSDFDSNCFTFGDETVMNLKKKIEEKGIPLKNWDVNIYRGITTGLNEVFIIDENTKNELAKRDKKSLEILKPILRGKDVNQWFYEFKGFYLIYSYTGIEIIKYEAIYDYLKQYKSQLEQVWEAKYGKKKWYELRGCDYYDEFEKEKIVWREIAKHSSFTWDSKNYFGLAKVFIMIGRECSKYLVAILNSSLGNYAIKKYYAPFLGIKVSEFKKEWVQKMPIPKISESEQKPFIELVDKILAITIYKDYQNNKLKQDKITELEKQIDQMVYKLYDLTPDEIKIVEGKND